MATNVSGRPRDTLLRRSGGALAFGALLGAVAGLLTFARGVHVGRPARTLVLDGVEVAFWLPFIVAFATAARAFSAEGATRGSRLRRAARLVALGFALDVAFYLLWARTFPYPWYDQLILYVAALGSLVLVAAAWLAGSAFVQGPHAKAGPARQRQLAWSSVAIALSGLLLVAPTLWTAASLPAIGEALSALAGVLAARAFLAGERLERTHGPWLARRDGGLALAAGTLAASYLSWMVWDATRIGTLAGGHSFDTVAVAAALWLGLGGELVSVCAALTATVAFSISKRGGH